MKNKFSSAAFSIGVVCLIMAFLMTLQIKSVMYNHAVNSQESLRVDELLKQLNEEKKGIEKKLYKLTYAGRLFTEGEKYIGFPYVWGGSTPETSFDCSGFVSWVLNHSGWNVGRLSAQGLYNICTPVARSNARPGDLVFFVGTYDTPGVSHVGIYAGNSMMIHCGDPITYANINTVYWQSHFYTYGRLP